LSARVVHRFLACALALPTLLIAAACERAPAPPHNDNLAGATVLPAAAQGLIAGTTIGSTRQTGEPRSEDASTVWFRWRAPSNGTVTFTGASGLPLDIDAFTGAVVAHLRVVAADSEDSKTIFRVAAGTNYAVRVDSPSGVTFSLKWSTSAPPSNDARAGAATIGGGAGSLVDDATAATAESADPTIDTAKIPATLWYRWTAPATGWYDFDTHGSKVNTALGIYTDATPVQLVADSAGDCGDFLSVQTASVRFSATAGTSYLVMVGGTNADPDDPSSAPLGGPVQLNWQTAAAAPVASGNDLFANATHLAGSFGSVSGNTDGATVETGEPANDGVPARASVWFAFTPTVSSDYILSSLPDDTDACPASLAVYTGSSVGALRAVQGEDEDALMSASLPSLPADDSGILISEASTGYGLRIHLFAGTTYRIAADGQASPGAFTLRWDIPQAAPVIRSVTSGNGSIGVIWAPPAPTSGSPRTGYFVAVVPANLDDFDSPEPQTLPVSDAFTTIRGLHNGASYRVLVAAINGSGLGNFALSKPIVPKKP
jgi:Fibronectin type III domain